MKLAVISDIHSDLVSLEEALREIGRQKCDKILCLGDIVGYSHHYEGSLDGRDADACIAMIKSNCDYVICGNHDLHAIMKLPSHHEKLAMPANWYDLDLEEKKRISGSLLWLYEDEIEDHIDDKGVEFLSKLPESLVIDTGNFRILATHFILPDITGTSKSSPDGHKDFKGHLKLLKKQKCLLGLAGHAHLEGFARISRRDYMRNYFRKTELLQKYHVIICPVLSRNQGSRGYIVLDAVNHEFEAISLN